MKSDELENFFHRRGVDGNCPACRYAGPWEHIGEDRDLELRAVGGGRVEVTAVLCPNCGFVRLHSLDAIQDTLERGDDRPPHR